MISAWLAEAWAKVAAWLAVLGALVIVVAAAFIKGKWDGERLQSAKQAARAVKTAQAEAKTEAEVQSNAVEAAQAVQQRAAAAPAPDTVKRDDFETTS